MTDRLVPSQYGSITIAAAAAAPGDRIILGSGYHNFIARVATDNLTVIGDQTNPGIVLIMLAGANTLTLGGTAPIMVNGGSGTITGNSAGNMLYTYTNTNVADTVFGGGGSDVIRIGGLTGATATDRAEGSTGLDRLQVEYSLSTDDLTVTLNLTGTYANGYGGTIENRSQGGATLLQSGGMEEFSIFTGSGNDIIETGDGFDVIRAGDGDDLINGGNGSGFLYGGNGNDTIYGGDGGSLTSTLYGEAGEDGLFGGDTADLLDGGAGADTMTGGGGGDTYYADNSGDIVTELTGGGTDIVYSSISFTLPDNVENLTLVDSVNGSATGNSLDNIITGDDTNNPLDGGTGADTLSGGYGNDTYVVEGKHDIILEGRGQGIDTAWSSGNFNLIGYTESLILIGANNIGGVGNSLNNELTGNDGDNSLRGRDGDDMLNGGKRDDILRGGEGADTFVFGAESGMDHIRDFTPSDGDIIDLSALSHGVTNGAGIIVSQVGVDTLIDLGGGNSIVVEYTTATDAGFLNHILW